MTKKPSTSQVRIIAGRWRGRKVTFYTNPGLRPTPDRVRETLFNWLAPYIQGAKCLDLFAGSGILGLEALSRGAAQVLAIEQQFNQYQMLLTAADKLAINLSTEFQVIQQDALIWLQQSKNNLIKNPAYNLVFLDPPYGQNHNLLNKCFTLLQNNHLLSADSLIYFEHNQAIDPLDLPTNWQPLKHQKTGQVYFYLYANYLSEYNE